MSQWAKLGPIVPGTPCGQPFWVVARPPPCPAVHGPGRPGPGLGPF